MRIGLSTKITEPASAASFVVAEEALPRFEVTLSMDDVYFKKNDNGRYYGVIFPEDFNM